MNILIVSAHDDAKSHTGQLYNTALGILERSGHKVSNSVLYAQDFNPVTSKLDFATNSGVHAEYIYEQQRSVNTGSGFSPDIKTEMDKVADADLILFHFPLWWGGPPAILKGWAERVLAMGFAWNTDNKYQSGLMKGKKALISVTVGDPESFYSADGMHNATVEQHLYGLLHRTLAFCGFDVHKPYIMFNTTAASSGEIEMGINKYRAFIADLENNKDFIYKS